MAINKSSNNNNNLSILKTSQAVVHISHGITLRQYKYWILLLHFYREAYKQVPSSDFDGTYRVSISKISEYLGYEPVKAELKADFEVLRKEPIVINILSKDGHKALATLHIGGNQQSSYKVSAECLHNLYIACR